MSKIQLIPELSNLFSKSSLDFNMYDSDFQFKIPWKGPYLKIWLISLPNQSIYSNML